MIYHAGRIRESRTQLTHQIFLNLIMSLGLLANFAMISLLLG